MKTALSCTDRKTLAMLNQQLHTAETRRRHCMEESEVLLTMTDLAHSLKGLPTELFPQRVLQEAVCCSVAPYLCCRRAAPMPTDR
eukprot:6189480-Pleurochrysis_carterae.AAC.3